MAIKAELFEKRYIDRDSVLLDTACFNHLFNSKRWFIEYEDIDPLSIGASNGGTGAAIGKGTVRVPLLLPDGSVNILEMPNTMYQPATPCNLISAGQLERNTVVQDGFNKTICFRDSKVVLGQYTIVDNVFVTKNCYHSTLSTCLCCASSQTPAESGLRYDAPSAAPLQS